MNRIYRLIALVGIGIVAIGAGSVTSAQASGPCASKKEFRKVKRGMDKSRVANILDTNGKLVVRSGPYSTREYKTCTRFSSVLVDFEGRSVISKTGFWF
jgi:hypothetical protein